jgi:dipeptidyl aminopeptidase/acylaminoacyl peptidase
MLRKTFTRMQSNHRRSITRSLPSTNWMGLLLSLTPFLTMAQTNTATETQRWLAQAGLAEPFKAPGSKIAWTRERLQIRSQLWDLLGDLPDRPKQPAVKTLSREDRGEFTLEKFEFDNLAGATVPGYLLLPKRVEGRVPGVLFCHWHGGQYDLGKEQMFQTNSIPEAAGPALARQGFAVLGIDAYCFGERNGRGPGGPKERGGSGEMTASKFNLWVGRTLWGMMLRDDLMALDYLASRPEVDSKRLGAMGISMGATRTWWLMALDERLKTGVAVACLTRYEDLIRNQALHAHGIYYFVPNLLKYFDTEAVISLIAPRPVLFMTGDQDEGSPVSGIHAVDHAVRPVYRLYGRDAEFQNLVYPGLGHVYTREMWDKTVAQFEKLKRGYETSRK